MQKEMLPKEKLKKSEIKEMSSGEDGEEEEMQILLPSLERT